jgi:hypothetical protein
MKAASINFGKANLDLLSNLGQIEAQQRDG